MIKIWLEKDEFGELPELSEKERETIERKARNYCLWSLNRSDKTRHQLDEKMRMKNCPEDIRNSTLDWLESKRYVDDVAYAESYVRNSSYAHRGSQYIQRQLRFKGVPDDAISMALENVDEDAEYEMAYEYGEKVWSQITRRYESREWRNRLMTKLNQRGYSFDIAGKVFEQLHEEKLAEEEEGDLT